MLKISRFVALSVAVFVVGTSALNAQNRSLNLERPTPSKIAKIASKPNVKVTAELQRQQKFFEAIAARYEEVSTYDLTPLLKFPYVWNALRENRASVAQPNAQLTPSQSRLFRKAYDLLEEETLLSFLDQQLNLLTESLELDEAQQEGMQNILTIDLTNKRSLLSAAVGPKDFQHRLDSISGATEKHILAILSPEQRRMFDRQQMFNRNRLVG